ncbi:TonB-dependent receptor [Terrimonas sp.]|uniref:TonB-dependent receptor domain-containing protein n=1 Tax=Terrimonas sp. TaxID=1914338 RepID=UPI000D514DD0|nr:TonB-dependent receptor [Terrimonas sp.]PVD52435.1 TonB-dependent receptor [Terrimonas sp.]
MKKLLLLVLLMNGLFAVAQVPGGQMPRGGGKPANIGHLYGKIIDADGKGIAEASVLLLVAKMDSVSKKNKDVLLKGMTTKSNGEFNLEELPIMGKLKLKISAVGYKVFEQEFNNLAMGGNFDRDLGNIKLESDAKQLETVVVTATKPMMQMDIDKKTFNVEKNIVTAGGTAVDVMRNVPSVQVDIDGNVKLRNAAPQIYVDGRPSTLSLDQIPADAIESVEVITNPSAKYDASGGNAGILNIVLKKNKKSGYNGNIMAGIDRRGGWNLGGNINLRQDKFNFSAALMSNQMRNRTTGTVDRYNLGDIPVNVFQDNLNKTKGGFLFGKVGLDYFVSNRTTISASVIRVHGKFKPSETIDIRTDSLLQGETISRLSERISQSSREFNALGFQGGIKHNFKRQGEEWTADFNMFNGKNEGDGLYTTNYYNSDKTIAGTQIQQNLGDGKMGFMTIQTDYVRPFAGATKLETGLRAQINNTENNNENLIKYPGATDYIKLSNASTNYKNTSSVYAAYVSFASTIKTNFGYKIGLRAESSNYKGDLLSTGQKFKNNYPVSLFPSLFLSQKLENKQELQFSVTRRVNRPNFFQLIPYTDYTDSLNITKGNPDLVPEFTYSAEFSYSKTFKGSNSLLATIYYKHTTDLITRYYDTAVNEISGKQDYISTYVNANSAVSYGSEITSINKLTPWWDITLNVNIYNSKINTDNVSGTSQDAMWSMFSKFNNNFKLPANFSIQLSADYQSKTNLPINTAQQFGPPMSQAQSASQGYIKAFYGVDLAIKKTFLKDNKASATLSFNDIFRSRKTDQYSRGIGFEQYYYRLNNPQMVRLTVSYRFGKIDMSLFKRQNMKSQQEGMQNGMQMQ